MQRTRLFAAAFAVALSIVPVAARAQSADSASGVDSLRPRTLQAVVVTAEKPRATRQGVLALMEENRRLAGVLREQDRKIDRLEARLNYLRTTATDSVNRQIASLDTQTAETRARREALEARLAALEQARGATATP